MFKKKKKAVEEEFVKYEPSMTEPPIEEKVEEIQEVVEAEEPVETVEKESIEPEEDLEELQNKVKVMEEKIQEAKKKKEASKIMVVKELPEAPIRNYQDKDGSTVSLITMEEAIGEILDILKSK